MGNSQTSANEATVAFFTSFGLVFAIGVAAALHAWFLLHRHWFRCDERRITERGRPGYSWYSRLYKPRYWPGTLAYLLFYVFVYFFQAYTLFRVWINVPVQKDQYGIAFIWVGMIWGLFNAVGSVIFFQKHDIVLSTVFYALAMAANIICLAMAGVLTWAPAVTHLPSVTVFVLQCIPTAGSIIIVVLLAILRVMNPDPVSYPNYTEPDEMVDEQAEEGGFY